MSVDTDEQMTQVESNDEQIAAEQLADAGAEAVETSTQDVAEEAVEQVSAADLAGTQPEKEKADKERNRVYAENRVNKKRIQELEKQVESGVLPEGYDYKPSETIEKPRLTDFKARLYDDFEGDSQLMALAYQEAKEDWQDSQRGIETGRQEHIDNVKRQIVAQRESEEAFEASIDEHRKVVANIDDSLIKAERLLGRDDFNVIRNMVGTENAALVLAVIGDNNNEQQAFMQVAQNAVATGNQFALVKHLAQLESRILSNLPSATKISTATTESPVDGGNASGTSDIDAKMEKAAKARDHKEYRRLKAIKEGKVA